MQAKITGSIVIYKNELNVLRNAVESFLSNTCDSLLYLIDNSPTDECSRYFRNERVRYIFNNKNIGFGPGHNLALRKILEDGSSTYHVVLNPDVYFPKGVFAKLSVYLEQHDDVGLVMPKILYPDGRLQPLCRLLPTPMTLVTRRFLQFFPTLSNKLNHWYEMHFSGYDKIMEVPFLSGCFMFLRTDVLRDVGLFDERIFLYTEDIDLTRRIHRKYKTMFFPDVTIYHYHQRASYKDAMKLIHHVSSAITYFNKWGWFYDYERKFINQRILVKFSQ